MPSGKTHTRIDLGMLGVTLLLAAFFWGPLCRLFGRDEMAEYGAIFVVAYLFGTFLLTPDMDLATSDPMANWGLLRFLWRPYAHLFKHRGISHMPIVGTLTRVAYILVLVYVISAVANVFLDLKWKMSLEDLGRIDRPSVLWALGGLCLPDLFHILADRMFKNSQ
ncbi:MAG: metal-binding protein [bacterium]|nr:metal-binding protein [bacterium]